MYTVVGGFKPPIYEKLPKRISRGPIFVPRKSFPKNHLSKAPGRFGFTANDATNLTLGKGLPKYTENEKVLFNQKCVCSFMKAPH